MRTGQSPEPSKAWKPELHSWLGTLPAALKTNHGGRVRLVVVAGCFDFIHPGSLKFLHQARSLGTELVVAVWDHATAAQLLGYDPVNAAHLRANFIAAFSPVAQAVVLSRVEMPLLLSTLAGTGDVVVAFWELDPARLWFDPQSLTAIQTVAIPTQDPRATRDYVPLFRRALS